MLPTTLFDDRSGAHKSVGKTATNVLTDDEIYIRTVVVPKLGDRMRLDRFLVARFRGHSRTAIQKGIVQGLVTTEDGTPLRPSTQVHAGQLLRIRIPMIAPTVGPPPFPAVLHEDARLVIINKTSGLVCHPRGTNFCWSVTALAKQRWPDCRMDLCHRLDRDTSGILILTKDLDANRKVKAEIARGNITKEYDALCRGLVSADHQHVIAPIGPADGPIRIQMAVRSDGLFAHTEVTVVARNPKWSENGMTWVRCRLHTGRSHQIRLHLSHVGHPIIGDRMYGVKPDVFLESWRHGITTTTIIAAGAPHHALHAAYVRLPHPDGGTLEVSAPPPTDFVRWWNSPEVLPLDGWNESENMDESDSDTPEDE
ncbi:MAG: RluA family pseudouridine synthase [Myxococcales bacterium]|nr:RluA family pseudouridine synthase [Myxococcales bacterium]